MDEIQNQRSLLPNFCLQVFITLYTLHDYTEGGGVVTTLQPYLHVTTKQKTSRGRGVGFGRNGEGWGKKVFGTSPGLIVDDL